MTRYEPETIETLRDKLGMLDVFMPGFGCWYGEPGKDVELAKMILDGVKMPELEAYIKEHYSVEEEDDYEEGE